MSELISRDLEYRTASTVMLGRLFRPESLPDQAPGVVVLHDAFGRSAAMLEYGARLARRGLNVLVADLWGGARQPRHEQDIATTMGSLIEDPGEWLRRTDAAHRALAALDEVDSQRIGNVGFCFGGSSALEYLRQGGTVAGTVSIHGGLNLLRPDWSAAKSDARVLMCTGSADPLATSAQRQQLLNDLDHAALAWELDLYAGAKHAFTNPHADLAGQPDVLGYDAHAARRAWSATEAFFSDLFADAAPA